MEEKKWVLTDLSKRDIYYLELSVYSILEQSRKKVYKDSWKKGLEEWANDMYDKLRKAQIAIQEYEDEIRKRLF